MGKLRAIGLDWFLRRLGIEPTEEVRAAWFTAESEQFERWRAGQIGFEEQRREPLHIVLPMIGLSAPLDVGDLDKLTVIGLLGAVDVVCTSEQVGAQKPDPRAFLEFAKTLEVAPSACLFIGDSAEQDIAGARGVGMRALLINRYGDHSGGIASAVQAELASAR